MVYRTQCTIMLYYRQVRRHFSQACRAGVTFKLIFKNIFNRLAYQMLDFTYYSQNPADTQSLGERLGKCLKPGIVMALIGELGCGKTLLTRGICAGLKVPLRQVNSPTFVLVNEYRGRLPVYHMDLYRLGDIDEIVDIGLLDYLRRTESGVMIIEWAEKVLDLLPDDHLKIEIEILSTRKRQLSFSAVGIKYEYLYEKVRQR